MKESAEQIERDLCDARRRTMDLIVDLADDQLLGPKLSIINPFLWEIGHVAWFQSNWVLRHLHGLPLSRNDADSLYDSFKVAHDTRWDLPLPNRQDTLQYMETELERCVEMLHKNPLDDEARYFYRLVTFHEDMHDEAFTYTRQTLALPRPHFSSTASSAPEGSVARNSPQASGAGSASRQASGEDSASRQASGADSASPEASGADSASPEASGAGQSAPAPRVVVAGSESTSSQKSVFLEVPGGKFQLGASGKEPFVFDNEKWGHEVEVQPFRMCKTQVTNEEFLQFVEEGGYQRQEMWDEEGWAWCKSAGAEQPVYWRRGKTDWQQRQFDTWIPLQPDAAIIHVNWFEASAYCRWAGQRLPSEAEWELAASFEGEAPGPIKPAKRRYPWGAMPSPTTELANLDGAFSGVVSVGAMSQGDSALGFRQMWGNVWEWTSTPFAPYPGFVVDPYKEYSEPWFDGKHMVLRGGCWATRSRLLRNTWRNFYTRERRDVFAGFRTCEK